MKFHPANYSVIQNKEYSGKHIPYRFHLLQVRNCSGIPGCLFVVPAKTEHLLIYSNEKMIPDEDLLKMLTRVPAKIWGLDLCGAIDTGKQADLVIASGKSGMKVFDHFYSLNPEDLLLVIHQGNIRMFDMDLMNQIKRSDFSINGFSKISLNGRIKYVEGDLPGLMNRIKKYYPAVVFPVSSS